MGFLVTRSHHPPTCKPAAASSWLVTGCVSGQVPSCQPQFAQLAYCSAFPPPRDPSLLPPACYFYAHAALLSQALPELRLRCALEQPKNPLLLGAAPSNASTGPLDLVLASGMKVNLIHSGPRTENIRAAILGQSLVHLAQCSVSYSGPSWSHRENAENRAIIM